MSLNKINVFYVLCVSVTLQTWMVLAQNDYWSNYQTNYYYNWNQNNNINKNDGFNVVQQSRPSDIQFVEEENAALVEGDSCIDTKNGDPGICLPIYKCPNVSEDFQKGHKPIICSYLSNAAVVCCPNKRMQQPKSTVAVDTPRPAVNFYNRGSTVYRLSEQKCDEYSKLAVNELSFTFLTVNTNINKVDVPSCSYNTGLIVGGEISKPGEFPHMAVIGWSDLDGTVEWKCGGSLISEYFVITAGHCTALHGIAPDAVRLGEHNLVSTDDRSYPQDFKIVQIIVHPDYKFAGHYNDVAVMRLDRRVSFSKSIRPACLWQSYDVNSTKVIATGWGQIEFGGQRSDDLRKVALNIVDNTQCNSLYDKSKKLRDGIKSSQICAGYLEGGRDTCQGDSGGPIQIISPKNKCIFYIVGVTSFGKGCAAANAVGVYTRISSYLDWIEATVWQS